MFFHVFLFAFFHFFRAVHWPCFLYVFFHVLVDLFLAFSVLFYTFSNSSRDFFTSFFAHLYILLIFRALSYFSIGFLVFWVFQWFLIYICAYFPTFFSSCFLEHFLVLSHIFLQLSCSVILFHMFPLFPCFYSFFMDVSVSFSRFLCKFLDTFLMLIFILLYFSCFPFFFIHFPIFQVFFLYF